MSFFYQLREPSLLPSLPTITPSLLSPPTTAARSLQSDIVIIAELLHCILNEVTHTHSSLLSLSLLSLFHTLTPISFSLQFSEDVFESVLIELQYHSEVVPLANDIATALLSL